MSVLKKTCEPFIQDGSCSEVTPKLMKCRECKMTPTQKNQTIPNIFCRFYAFRRYVHKLNIGSAGFFHALKSVWGGGPEVIHCCIWYKIVIPWVVHLYVEMIHEL